MLSVKYLAPGVDKTEFHNILMVGRSDVGVITSYKQVIMYPPTVSLDQLCYHNSSIGDIFESVL